MPPLEDLDRPFTRRMAREAGVTDMELRGPRYQQVFRGIHVGARVPVTSRLRAEAALLLHGKSAFASHLSAARVLGLPVPASAHEHVTVDHPDQRRRTAGVRCHVSRHTEDVTVVAGLRVSSCARVFVELSSLLDTVDLVVVGDHMARHGLMRPDDLRDYCTSSRMPGAATARRAATYVRDHVDSPMETRLRMLLVLAGLPEPMVNVVVRDVDGTPLRRYDLSYPRAKVAVEYDGRQHVERESQWERDLDRREAIDDAQWRLVVVTARGIYRAPEETLRRVHRLLLSRGAADVPRHLRDTWRPHFRGHG